MNLVEPCLSLTDAELAQLVELLMDAVEHGASVGYVMPMSVADARQFWSDVAHEIGTERRSLLVVRESNRILGAVQIEFASKPNGRHRAEIQKMLVHSSARRRGHGRRLMQAAEAAARANGRSLLVLDTETASAGQRLYETMGFLVAGEIPKFAIGTHGGWSPSTFMYKLL